MRKLHLLLATAAVFTISSCGGGGGSTTPTPVTTQAPAPARIAVTQDGTAQVCNSPFKKFRVGIPIVIAETGGQGFFVNFAQMTLFKAGHQVESTQIGAADITAVSGSNHFAARSTTRATVIFDFNHLDFDGARTTFDFTDDRGNHSSVDLNGIDPIVVTEACAFVGPRLNDSSN